MLKKVLAVVLSAVMLFSLIPVSANATSQSENGKTATDYGFSFIKPVIENNKVTYVDENGDEVDIASYNRERVATYSRLPESFNLLDEGRVTSVKSQGELGLCWDFAATASLESSILTIPELREQLPENAQDVLDLSEVGNTWYLHTNIEDENSVIYNDYVSDPAKGTKGAWAKYVGMGLSSGFGAYPEELMPYESWNDGCYESHRFYSDYRLREVNLISQDNELFKQLLMEKGAFSISFNCFSSNFNDVDGVTAYYDNGSPIVENDDEHHAVTLVGWDDNFSKEYFCEDMRPENDGAWLCKNSWGDNWGCTDDGLEGYFWISYETMLDNLTQFEAQSVENFDNIYQHEVASDNWITEIKKAANVFTAQSDEELKQICFSNFGFSDFTVDVYKLNENYTSPEDGELLTSFSDSVDFSGIHCVDCPQGVYLSKGDVFSVVIIDGNGLSINYSNNYESPYRNISYIMGRDGEYTDIADIEFMGNVCIKAYTKNKDGAVKKDELSQSIKTAESIEKSDNFPTEVYDELENQLTVAKELMESDTATQNMVDNCVCLLNACVEKLETYFYEINTLDDFMDYYFALVNDGYFESRYIILNTDLDLSSIEDFTPLYNNKAFSGVFEGNNHTISNVKINLKDENVGFFYKLQNATVRNLTFKDCDVVGGWCVGAVASESNNSTVENCDIINSQISSIRDCAGGIFGYCEDTVIKDCDLKDTHITGRFSVGPYMTWYTETTDCTCENVTLSSPESITGTNDVNIFGDTQDRDKMVMMTLCQDKCIVENLIGKIENISVDSAEVTKNGDSYEFSVENGGAYFLTVDYEDIKSPEFLFTFDVVNRELELIGYYGDSEDVVFPSEIAGVPVTSISNDFEFCGEQPIKSITFSGGLKKVQSYAFMYLWDLEKVTFEEGVEYIGVEMFDFCYSLKEVVLPDSLLEIGNAAFSYCQSLESVKFGNSLKKIGSSSFMMTQNLKGVEFPDSLETLGFAAFEGSGATSVVFGKNIEKVYENSVGFTTYTGEGYKFIKIPDFKIYGYAGTDAQRYAEYNGFEFIDITEGKPEIVDEGFDYSAFKKGDVDLDSKITIFDATLIQKYLADLAELNGVQEYNAIVGYSLSNQITIMSTTEIQRYLAGIVPDLSGGAYG